MIFSKLTQKIVLLILVNLYYYPIRGSESHFFPVESCEVQWDQYQDREVLFDPSVDSIFTPLGNLGYSLYQSRLQEKKIDRQNCYKSWTILLYMAANNNLNQYALADLIKMESISHSIPGLTGSSKKIDLLVEIDSREKPFELRRFHIFQNADFYLEDLNAEKIKDLKLNHIRSPITTLQFHGKEIPYSQKIIEFLDWGIQSYPSKHYLFLFWGHAQGWTAISSSSSAMKKSIFGGIGMRETEEGTDYLSTLSLHKILGFMSHKIGKKIDIFATDACLMQNLETLVELGPETRFICGSEEIESFAGLPYQLLFRDMNQWERNEQHSEDDRVFELAKRIPTLYKESFDPTNGCQRKFDSSAHWNFIYSTIQTESLINNLIPAINELGYCLCDFVTEKDERWMDLKVLVQRGPHHLGGYQDFGNFLENLRQLVRFEKTKKHSECATANLESAIQNAYLSLNESLICSELGNKYVSPPSSELTIPRGVAIWLPKTDEEFIIRYPDFFQSYLYHFYTNRTHSGWKKWMLMIYPVQKQSSA